MSFERGIGHWRFEDYFASPPPGPVHLEVNATIVAAREYLAQARIADHPFFSFAKTNSSALREWAIQEAVITNDFSQVLFLMMSSVKNVHLRTLLLPVVAGEHSRLANGVAANSHPFLLLQLVEGLGIRPSEIRPLPCTVTFAEELYACTSSTLFALGVLGPGNESMIVPEYTAVKAAFAHHHPTDFYSKFLDANIKEDIWHSDLLERGALLMFKGTLDEAEYLRGAKTGVDARVAYYDRLLAHCEGTV